MKTKRSIVIYAFLVILLAFCLPFNVSARNWKTGGVANPDTLEHKTLEKWTELVKEKTNGKIKIDAFPSETYCEKHPEIIPGIIDACYCSWRNLRRPFYSN